ncbi:hypothetical protein EON82_00905 [bacterium]|nr:MAG: hypothetical protein EON82_00905 [bacterium]
MTCPNCGHPFEGYFCPRCGWTMPAGPNRAGAILILVFLALPFTLVGGCSAMMAVQLISSEPHNGSGIGQVIVMTLAFSLLSSGMFAIVFKLWRS